MVLLSFSEEKHVPLILNGRKRQTTRPPRKNPIKVGDTLQVYYKSRCLKTCLNCIYDRCMYAVQGDSDYTYAAKCDQHTNFFGNAVVTSVKTILFTEMPSIWKEAWAIADGFDSWEQADEWFTEHNGPHWTSFPWVVITWDPDWLKKEAL